MRLLGWFAGVVVVALGLGSAAVGQEPPRDFSAGVLDSRDVIDEIRIGGHFHQAFTSLFPRNPDPINGYDWTRPEDVSFDVLFTSPDIDAFRWIGSPRPELGTTLNFAGRDSLAHASLTWQAHLFDSPIFAEFSFGGAIHNGYLTDAPDGRRNLGCRVNFYERFGVGADLSEQATVMVGWEHTSNADLCEENEGFSNVGVRVGWKF